ncbi:MAG: stage III sporulation protein AG [Oscillospiraceae bacterium]|nr:stage III sporulation protein AG [Oscillospiraceae bacterium]
MIQLKDLWDRFWKNTGGEKRIRWILAAGILGIALILLSEIWPRRQAPPENAVQASAADGEYAQALEERLLALVTSIRGVGEARVWVTLESGTELVYAHEEIKNTDTTQDYGENGVKTLREKDNSQQKLILIEGADGQQEPLVRTQREPVIQGVVVVCRGAGDMEVVERVTEAVTCALGVSSSRVCVTQLEG